MITYIDYNQIHSETIYTVQEKISVYNILRVGNETSRIGYKHLTFK